MATRSALESLLAFLYIRNLSKRSLHSKILYLWCRPVLVEGVLFVAAVAVFSFVLVVVFVFVFVVFVFVIVVVAVSRARGVFLRSFVFVCLFCPPVRFAFPVACVRKDSSNNVLCFS